MAERKDLIQDIMAIEASDLLSSVSDMKSTGHRLGQACASKTGEGLEVLYSFEKDETLKNLKVTIKDKPLELQSISNIYWAAFIYENEMHDLFGITFKNLALDYGGHFFKVSSETPWNPPSADSHEDTSADDESAGESADKSAAGADSTDGKGGEA